MIINIKQIKLKAISGSLLNIKLFQAPTFGCLLIGVEKEWGTCCKEREGGNVRGGEGVGDVRGGEGLGNVHEGGGNNC